MSYTHFTLEEREYLHQKRMQHWSIRAIAYSMNRSPSSVSREIRRNTSTDGRYRPYRADSYARTRSRKSRYKHLVPGTDVWNYVIEKLMDYWTPEQISARWSIDHPEERPIAFSTIYHELNAGNLPNINRKQNLRRRGKRKQNRSIKFNTITPDRIIPDWPKSIVNRSRFGDWEGDTVAGKVGTGFITTLVDRKSRYLLAYKVESKLAKEQLEAVVSLLKDQPVRSISFDNGSEFAEHHAMEQQLSTKIYFAEPHKPWQRGTNENTNGILRFFFPKGSDFTEIKQEDVEKAVYLINNRPRKCLGWKTPAEVYSRKRTKSVALD